MTKHEASEAADAPPITHERTDHRGAFVMERDGKRLAEMTYTIAGSRVIIDHTRVDDALRGTGAGKKLVEAAVQWARTEKVKILPPCPFAKSVFDKTSRHSARALLSANVARVSRL